MLTAVGHLSNHGYVFLMQRVDGEQTVLLSPDLLVNLASSVVLEARRHERGLGMVDETRLLAGQVPLRRYRSFLLAFARLCSTRLFVCLFGGIYASAKRSTITRIWCIHLRSTKSVLSRRLQ